MIDGLICNVTRLDLVPSGTYSHQFKITDLRDPILTSIYFTQHLIRTPNITLKSKVIPIVYTFPNNSASLCCY